MSTSFRLRSSLLAVLLSLPLISCVGGGGSDAPTSPPVTPVPTTPTSVTVTNAAGRPEARLACFKGVVTPECNLRLYQVMVESFIDGDPAANYNTGYGTSSHKGDIQGIIDSLDYIKSTGVNALWLTPIFESTAKAGQVHWTDRLDATGYFGSNYFRVDPKFGTDAQFRKLVDEAHARGLYVLLDGVFGHYKDNIAASPTGKLPKSGACTGIDGNNYQPGEHQACADFSDPATLAFFQEVVTHWITNYKVDGFRVDQAYQVPAAAWGALRQTAATASAAVQYTHATGTSVSPLAHFVGEIWGSEGQILNRGYGSAATPGLASAFDFPGRYRLVQTLAGEEAAPGSGRYRRPASTLNEVSQLYAAFPDAAMPNLMLTNHDLVRFGDLLQRSGTAQPADDAYWARHKAAFAFMAAHSGPVTLYYGDELGLEVPNFAANVSNECAVQGLCDDHVSRSPGKVTGLTERESNLKDYVAQLMRLRDANPALAVGSRTFVYADAQLYIERKETPGNRVLFVLNTGTHEVALTLKAAALGAAGSLTDLQSDAVITAGADGYALNVPPLSGRFLKY